MVSLRIKQVLKFIEENLEKGLTLEKVAKQFNLNYTYLCELFKREVGVCFSEYFIKVRIKKTKELLKDKTLLIKRISPKAGYKHVSNFSRDFKRITKLGLEEHIEIIKKYKFLHTYHAVILIRRFANKKFLTF